MSENGRAARDACYARRGLRALATFVLLPRRYESPDRLLGVAVFWHEDGAFVFPDRHATARSTNTVVERLPQSGWWAVVASLYTDWRTPGHATTAYRLAGSAIDRHDLPDTVIAPSTAISTTAGPSV